MVRTLADQAPEPGWTRPDQNDRADQADQGGGPDGTADQADQAGQEAFPVPGGITLPGGSINTAAVIAYRDSLRVGAPLSEHKLAEMFGLTSRRWARNRIAEARQSPVAA
jgi:hypothetical protein